MNRDVDDSAQATLGRFLIESEIPVRELAELAIANWMAARNLCSDERGRKDLIVLAELLLECGRKIVECWTTVSRRAALAR
jgi:hypothetical protein